MKKLTLLTLMAMLALITHAQPPQSIKGNMPAKNNIRAQIIKEYGLDMINTKSEIKGTSVTDTIFFDDFAGSPDWGLPNNWAVIKNSEVNKLMSIGEEVMMAKTDSLMFLISPKIDFTNAKFLEFFSKGDRDNICSIGYMTDSLDATTFTQIDSFVMRNIDIYVMDSFQIKLNGVYSGEAYLAFQFKGESGYFYIDNILVSSDDVSIDYPDRVSDLSVTPGAQGALSATLNWTNPAKQVDGDNVTLTKAYVYYSPMNQWGAYPVGTLVDSVNTLTAGGTSSVTIDNTKFTSDNNYMFQVVVVSADGTSKPIKTSTYVGHDKPGKPGNIVFAIVDGKPKVTWTAPTGGINDGYFDVGSITNYVVKCSNGKIDTVANVLEFIGDTITNPDVYNYSVFAINNIGNGLVDFSNALAVAQGDYFLFDNYKVDPLTTGWTINGVGQNNWAYKKYSGGLMDFSGPFSGLPSFTTGTSRLVSPVLNTTGARVLQLDFTAVNAFPFWSSAADPYEFSIQTTSDGGTTWNVVFLEKINFYGARTPYSLLFGGDDIGSENFQVAFCFTGAAKDIYYMDIYNMAIKQVEGVDMALLNVTCPDVAKIGSNVAVTANVKNMGSIDTLVEITTVFVLDGVAQVTSTIKIDKLYYGQDSTVTFPNWTAVDGIYDVVTYVSSPNDINSINDTIHMPLMVFDGIERNMVVVEDATGTWCNFCPGAQMGIEDLKNNGYNITGIAYHAGNDPYKIPDGIGRIHYYGIVSYPTTMFDGVIKYAGGSYNQSMYSTYIPFVEERMARVTPIKLDVAEYNYNETSRVVTAKIIAERVVDVVYIPDSLRVRVAFTETNIDQVWMTQTKVNDVLRGMTPYTTAGAYVDLINKASDTVEVTFTVDTAWVAELMEMSVFVQNERTKEIMNANKHEVKVITDKPDLTVSINNFYNEPVEGVTVVLDGHNYTTGSNGQAVIADLTPGGHTFAYSKDGYLPTYPSRVIVDLEDKELDLQLIEGEIIYGENFDEGELPDGWSFSDHAGNWQFSSAATSGGAPYELLMYFNPQFNGKSALVSPNIPLKSMMNANDHYFFMLKYTVNDYNGSGGYSLSGRMVSESNADTSVYWYVEPHDNVAATTVMNKMNYADITEDNVRLEYEFEGNTFKMNWWTIDDIWIVKLVVEAEAPTAPANLTASDISNNSVVLTWDASTDNIGVEGYYVYQGDEVVATVVATVATITGLDSETEYTFTVKAFDAADNISDASNAVTITTLTGINDNVAEAIGIYPNPAKNTLSVSSDIQGELNIYSITGHCLYTDKDFNSNKTIDVSMLEKGLYIISIKNENKVYSAKVNIVK